MPVTAEYKVMDARSSARQAQRIVVAHVNYLFFHSTQTFIYFFLSRFKRVRPICLTRMPESTAVTQGPPPSLAEDFYLYGQQTLGASLLKRLLWSCGITVRRLLARVSPRLAEPLLDIVHRRIVPQLRPEANAERLLAWAEDILRQRNARLIHAYFGPVGWRMLSLKRKLGLPLVVTFLGDEISTDLEPWWWWWIQLGPGVPDWPARLRELLQEGDLFLAEGPFLRQRLIDFGCPPEKVQIQHIAIPVRQMPFRPARQTSDGKVVLLFAGRFCEQKGVLYALEAVREVWQERRNIEFRMIGDEKLTDGKYAAQIYAFIRKHHLHDCVRLLGFLNHADYLCELQQADIFLHPSVTGANGISEGGAPTTILEAQALGIPVVSTVHCDIPNVTLPGESAILVPERDSKSLALALMELIDHPEKWPGMGSAGRKHMEAHYDIENEVPALEEKYLALLSRSSRGVNPSE
jgi:colanic acid/amylovoran biosynthesis glycosyltransferase